MSEQASVERLRIRAQFDWLSGACALFPRTLGRYVMGPNPVHWRLMHTPADYVEWVRRPGDPHAGRRPATFTRGVLVAIAHEAVDNVARMVASGEGAELSTSTRIAVAFRVGEAVLATEMPPPIPTGSPLAAPEDLPGYSTAIVGVGQEDLEVAVGIMRPRIHEFTDARYGVRISDVAPFQDLSNMYPTTRRI